MILNQIRASIMTVSVIYIYIYLCIQSKGLFCFYKTIYVKFLFYNVNNNNTCTALIMFQVLFMKWNITYLYKVLTWLKHHTSLFEVYSKLVGNILALAKSKYI